METESEIINKLAGLEHWLTSVRFSEKELFLLGFFVFIALLVVLLSKKYKIPIVVGYVFIGIILSVDIVGLIPFVTEHQKAWYEFTISQFDYVTQIALGFIAFTIGSELSIKLFKNLGKSIIYISILESFAAFAFVFLAVYLIGQPLYVAMLLGAIAAATAPAATVMVLREFNAEGPLTSTIMAVVGIDDAIALIIFSLIRPIAYMRFTGTSSFSIGQTLFIPFIEIFGSILLGLGLGYLAQKLLGSFDDKTKKILTFITTIIGSAALSVRFGLSPLITNMSVGFAFRNFTRKNLGISEYLDTITVPIYAVFFILAGTEIRFSSMGSLSFLLIALTYLLARIIGKVGGSSFAARISDAPDSVKKYIGFGLLPQSGVAIALAYSVQRQFAANPEVGLLIFNVLLLTAAATEVFGPLATKYAIFQAGEANEH